MDLNDILQWTAIAVILIVTVAYIIRKVTRRHNGCCGCGLKNCCNGDDCGCGKRSVTPEHHSHGK